MANKQIRTRSWCFTLNNPTALIVLDDDKVILQGIQYLLYQKEKAPTTGTIHLQGYVYFANPRARGGVQLAISKLADDHPADQISVRACRGNVDQNNIYCTKEDRLEGPFEWGNMPKQGARTDLEEIKNLIKNGATEAEVAERYFGQYVRYYRGIREYRTLTARKRNWKTKVVVHYGSTGLGKTYRTEVKGGERLYVKDADHKWFHNYQGEDEVCLEEFDGRMLGINTFKRIADRGRCSVEYKGGTVEWSAKTLYVTSNTQPAEWWPDCKSGDFEAIVRRVDEWWHFTRSAVRVFRKRNPDDEQEDQDGQIRYGEFLGSCADGSISRTREYPEGRVVPWIDMDWANDEDLME